MDFDHPLWVLYGSGTTGPPKAIVHSHGGMLLELLKTTVLQLDLQPHDRFFWFTTTGWVMWNIVVGALLPDAAIVPYDGNPGGDALWRLAARTGTTFLGTSAAFLDSCLHDEVKPPEQHDLTALRAIGSTGSPLAAECYDWACRTFPERTWLVSISGGTDVVGPFLGAVPTVPVYRGNWARPRWVSTCVPTPTTGERGREPSANWSSGSPSHRCRSASGVTTTGSACVTPTSAGSPACGPMATGSSSPRAGPASSPGAATRRSTAAGFAPGRPRSTRRCSRCPKWTTPSPSTCRGRVRRAG
ncbi:AMP-binding protein [Amycolatopsis endophytica]|uniref:AMP-binding protein n=1 Tax=Amycolatopsis endophytica TaxID=860233 RepID=UPI0035E43A34